VTASEVEEDASVATVGDGGVEMAADSAGSGAPVVVSVTTFAMVVVVVKVWRTAQCTGRY